MTVRQTGMRFALACMTILFLYSNECQGELSEDLETLPNIVILYADDLGYGDVRCLNEDSRIPVPNLDRLAREGVVFSDAHSSSGICTPSRYALLAGRYHWRAFHDIVDSFGQPRLPDEMVTMPEMLREKGYRTACIGKWHLGWDWNSVRTGDLKPGDRIGYRPEDFDWRAPIPGGPCDHGFDYYFGDDVPNFPPYAWFENDRIISNTLVPFSPFPKPPEATVECRPGPREPEWKLENVLPALADKAVEWVESSAGQDTPFFLFMSFTSPHAPIVPAAEFIGKSGAGPYGDFVTQTDSVCGRILDALDRMKIAENTIVIFSSDNGPEIFCYERLRKFQHRSMGNLRGIKRDVWEGGHRVPMIIRWPNRMPPSAKCDQMIGQLDLYATLASITGIELHPSQAEDSLNQLPLLLEPSGPAIRTWLIHNTYPKRFALREQNWLYLDGPDGNARPAPDWFAKQEGWQDTDEPYALYDLKNDPGQKSNLFLSNREIADRMAKRLIQLRESPGSVRTSSRQ